MDKCSQCNTTSRLYEYFHGWHICYFCDAMYDRSGAVVDRTHFPYVCPGSDWDKAAQKRVDAFIEAWEAGKRGSDLRLEGERCQR